MHLIVVARRSARLLLVGQLALACGGAQEKGPNTARCDGATTIASASAASTEQVQVDKNALDIDDSVDYGDGPVHFTWNISKRTLTLAGKPALRFDGDEKVECLHITGLSHINDDKSMLVVVSTHFGPQTCNNERGHSVVHRYDGKEWKKIVATVGGELHLRDDGPENIEWKLVSAEASNDGAGWSKTKTKKFPPASPKPSSAKDFGFVKP